MQNTRLNTLLNRLGERLGNFFSNPWRSISLIVISALLGIFLGTAIPTTAGQDAEWDVLAAGLLLLFTETVNRFYYGKKRKGTNDPDQISLFLQVLNALKLGLTYSLFVEAFKLGS